MAKKLILPKSIIEASKSRRISSTTPSLTPDKRAEHDVGGYTAEYHQSLIAEAQTKANDAIAPDGSRPRTSLEAQQGKGMWGKDVKVRIEKLNPNLVWLDGNPPDKVWVIKQRNTDQTFPFPLVTVCCMPKGFMPEFSTIVVKEKERFNKDTRKVEKRQEIDATNPEIRGWRTVLVKLIKAGLITEAGAAREFGMPTHDSARWQAHLK